MRRECLITSRVAGPCATCRQPAWPAHVWPDGRILCGNCCPCARRDAAPGRDAAGPDNDAGPVMPREAGPGHDALAADRGPAENRPGTGLPAGAGASPGHGWWGSTGRPDPGPLEALSGPARDLAAQGLPAPEAARKASHTAAPLAGPAPTPHNQAWAADRGKNISLPECSGYNLIWRLNSDGNRILDPIT